LLEEVASVDGGVVLLGGKIRGLSFPCSFQPVFAPAAAPY